MTVVLVLLCLAIAGREIYLAFDRKQPRVRAELRLVEERVQGMQAELHALTGRLAELGLGPADAEPAADADADGVPAGSLARSTHVDPQDVAALRGRLRRMEAELVAATGRLAELEHGLANGAAPPDGADELAMARWDRASRQAFAKSLDSVEEAVGTLQSETIERLEHEAGEESDTVSGLLYGGAVADRWLLTNAYEMYAGELGLRIRVRESAGHGPWRTTYYFSGGSGGLSERLLGEVRGLDGPQDDSVLSGLLTVLGGMASGAARVGRFAAVRTPDGLLCGLLADAQLAADPQLEPAELAGLLTDLPPARRVELTRWFAAR